MRRSKRCLIIASYPDSLLNFRGDLIAAMQSTGCEVHVAAPFKEGCVVYAELAQRGVQPHVVRLSRTGINPFLDLLTLVQLWVLALKIRPIWVLSYTIKPVIYGTLAAWAAGVPKRCAMITGLGYAFVGDGGQSRASKVARLLYKTALRGASLVLFQNGDDKQEFVNRQLLGPATPTYVVAGSGVNLQRFAYKPAPVGEPVFLMIARLLKAKGVREYAAAATALLSQYPQVRCRLVGWIDQGPDAISERELDGWVQSGAIDYVGKLADVRPELEAASVFVLPSYREGTPRTVLEAMSVGRPIITTDAPGCRQTVKDGSNGYLVPVQDSVALAGAMEKFVISAEQISGMGQVSRELVEATYDVDKVNQQMLSLMEMV
jgi:glycosyltransferase involved in cell wall biosynthesis